MIQKFVDRFVNHKPQLEAIFKQGHPEDYAEIVKHVVSVIGGEELDSERIHLIDDGDYQGTLLFVIGAKGYQPYEYWYVKVAYGSCSGCDTFESIRGYSSNPPTEEQVKDYMTLALHIVEGLHEMQGEVI